MSQPDDWLKSCLGLVRTGLVGCPCHVQRHLCLKAWGFPKTVSLHFQSTLSGYTLHTKGAYMYINVYTKVCLSYLIGSDSKAYS